MLRWCLVLLAACCPGKSWSHTDTALELAFVAEMTVDTVQTGVIVDRCVEVNPVIGACGDRVPYQVYQPAAALLHAGVSYLLAPRWRTIWQAATVGMEGHVVFVNAVSESRR